MNTINGISAPTFNLERVQSVAAANGMQVEQLLMPDGEDSRMWTIKLLSGNPKAGVLFAEINDDEEGPKWSIYSDVEGDGCIYSTDDAREYAELLTQFASVCDTLNVTV